MDTFNIIISTRLKTNPVARHLTDLGTDIRYTTLRRGEFLLGDRFGVKYLTSVQFLELIKNRSIYREIIEMKREFAEPVLIIEGEDPYRSPEVGLATIHGAVLFASVMNRVPILTTRNDLETAQLIFMMAAQTNNDFDWHKKAAASAAPMVTPDNNSHGDPYVSIIAKLPDIGPALAEGLLKHFGSLSRLFAADISDLKKVAGIGSKRAERIYAFLNGKKAA